MAKNVTKLEHPGDVPEKIGKYVIINKIGKGSTGMVYLSHDPYYRRDVAIKVYNTEEDLDADRARVSRKMFFNEAHMVGMLQHPNILPIYDAGEEDGKYYVVTEHIQGARTLAAYCRPDNLLRVDDVVEIIYKVAKALHYAHGRGVIHSFTSSLSLAEFCLEQGFMLGFNGITTFRSGTYENDGFNTLSPN